MKKKKIFVTFFHWFTVVYMVAIDSDQPFLKLRQVFMAISYTVLFLPVLTRWSALFFNNLHLLRVSYLVPALVFLTLGIKIWC